MDNHNDSLIIEKWVGGGGTDKTNEINTNKTNQNITH